ARAPAATAACAPALTVTPPASPRPATVAPSAAQTPPGDSGFPVPDKTVTPGAVATTDLARLCPHVDPALEAARPSSSEKARVYATYGLDYPQPPGTVELDHLIPIELGGAPNDPANEWPELNDRPDPSAINRWGLSPPFVPNSKDSLEHALHQPVGAGKVPLGAAQRAMTAWPAAYAKYVGQP